MKYHFCPVCWNPVRHPYQTTCSKECLANWRNLQPTIKTGRLYMATVSPEERQTLILEEEEQRAIDRAARVVVAQEALAEYQTKQHDLTPAFIREALNPANVPTGMPTIAPTANGHSRDCTCEQCIGPYKTKKKGDKPIDGESESLDGRDIDPTGD